MKRICYEVRNVTGWFPSLVDGEPRPIYSEPFFTQVLPEDEVFEPPPWVRFKIENQGATVVQWEMPDSGLNDHGQVDWQEVAQALYEAISRAMEPETDQEDPATVVGPAMDRYQVALAEVEMHRAAQAETMQQIARGAVDDDEDEDGEQP